MAMSARSMTHAASDRLRRRDDRGVAAADRQELHWFVGQMRQRHASSLYLAANERPAIRVDARIEPLRDALAMAPSVIEGVWRAFVGAEDAANVVDHVREVPELGRVRGRRSGDAHGVGVVLVVEQIRADLSPHLALPALIRKLALERTGLVVHCGPPGASGQRTLRAALLDTINRTRQAHIITIEDDISILHDRKAALVSQRDLSGTTLLAAIEAARAEQPDVLMVKASADRRVLTLLFEMAASGRLVVCGMDAPDVAGALTAMAATCEGEERAAIFQTISGLLKGAIAQVLVPRSTGGRAAAREVLVATPAVAKAIAAGRLSQLPLLLADGRKDGMNTLNDALIKLVETRDVSVEDAMAAAVDSEGVKEMLRRRGLQI
jgi:twitching motility protein PilT